MNKQNIFVAVQLIAVLLISRLVPHPQNFSALTAVALFAASYWSKSQMRFIVPLLAMVVTDIYLGFYPGMLMNYFAVILGGLVAPNLGAHLPTIFVRSTLASVIFFVVSNLGVWWSAGLYPHTLNGLMDCYILAIPFFKNTFISSLFYSFVFYSSYRLIFYEKGFEGFLKTKHG